MIYSDTQVSAYLERIGAQDRSLVSIQRAHRLAIPFENLDIPLGRGLDLDPDRLFDKLVLRRRGGYCFEQNALLLEMLRSIGFAARPVLGRVWLMADSVPARTHTLNLVTIDGEDNVADAGFGGSYTPPMKRREGEGVTTPDGARHRLTLDPDFGWMVERDGGAGWVKQYSFTLDAVWPADLEMANHWTSTRPRTRFTKLRVVSRALPDGYASMIDRTLTLSIMGESTLREVESAADYRAILSDVFALDLAEDEVASLGLF
jgi:N-hydroxyarylamine O-acetyltransferase